MQTSNAFEVCPSCGRNLYPIASYSGFCMDCQKELKLLTVRGRCRAVRREDGRIFKNRAIAARETYGNKRDYNGMIRRACDTGKPYRGIVWSWADGGEANG